MAGPKTVTGHAQGVQGHPGVERSRWRGLGGKQGCKDKSEPKRGKRRKVTRHSGVFPPGKCCLTHTLQKPDL